MSEPALYTHLREVVAAAKVPWRPNALRRSFISYRMATVKNENQASLEAGNSPAMIFSDYRQLVTEPEGREWFAIMPGT